MAKSENALSRWISGGEIAEQSVCLVLFFLLIPMLFNAIDRSSRTAAVKTETKVASPRVDLEEKKSD